MGNNMSGICCHNDYAVKGGENDIQLFKKEFQKARYEDDENSPHPKVKFHKNIFEKQFKDNSLKQNSFQNSQIEYRNRLEKLNEFHENNPSLLLSLKVLNSNVTNKQKGETIQINCLGLIDKGQRDGFVYFGFTDKTGNDRIDFELPVQNVDIEGNM
jgi:hypothetical protein